MRITDIVGAGPILGYLMYRSGLVPRGMAILGLIGGPLIMASGIAIMLDVIERESILQDIATIPEFFWELSLGIYCIVKGFRPSPILTMQETVQSPRVTERQARRALEAVLFSPFGDGRLGGRPARRRFWTVDA